MRALRHRNFQLFFSGQLISLIGTWMQTMAQAWLVYRITGSSLLLGAVGFASQFPVFLVAPLGGIVADRHHRQRVVIGTQVASMILALILALLTLTGRVQVWHIFVLAALLGVVNAFDIPGRQAFLVDMVGKEDLMNAIALNSSMFNGARIIGPAIAGILVAKIGEGWCFFANGVSYIAVIIGLLMMRVQRPARRASAASPLAHIIEGFRFVRQYRADPGHPAPAGIGKSGGDALHHSHAHFRGQDSARRRPRPGNSDGRNRRRSLVGRAHAGVPYWCSGIGKVGRVCLRRLRSQSDSVFSSRGTSGSRPRSCFPWASA